MSDSAANKLAIALAVREAMREHRKGKPIAFQPRLRAMKTPDAAYARERSV